MAMTVNTTKFTNWQDGRQPGVPWTSTAPAITSIKDEVLKRWGGGDLGSYGVRPVRAGESWSSHAFGAAWDWRWENPGPGRAVLEAEVLPWLIDHSSELGVQAIHDYHGCRIWRSNRGDGKGAYWKPQPASGPTGMGQSWAQWLHIEVTADAWADGTPAAQKVRGAVDVPKATMRRGSRGQQVEKLHSHLLFFKFIDSVKKPAVFTKATEAGVKKLQSTIGVKADGVYGPQTQVAYTRWLANHGM